MAGILDFYKGSCFWGTTVVQRDSWINGTTPTLTVDPAADHAIYVASISLIFPDTLVLSPNTLDIQPWGQAVPPKVSVSTIEQFYELATWIGDKNVAIGSTPYHWIRIDFRPFILVTDSGAETFTVVNSGGATAAMTGTLRFAVIGHDVLEADL